MSQEGIQKSLQIPELRFPNFSDDEWKTFYLNDLSNKISDGLHSTPNYVDESNIFFINGNNLINGNIIINDNTKCINFKEFQKYNNNLDQNTILISINGTIGNLSFFNNENIILSKSVAFIKLKENTDKFFIYYLLQTNKIKYYFESELTGTTIRNLSLKSLKNMNIKIPTLEEQKKIGTFLSEIDTKIALMEKKQEELEIFKKYIINNLFNSTMIKDGWKSLPLKEFLHEHKLKSTGSEEVYSVSVSKGVVNQVEHMGRSFSAKNTDKYNLVQPDDIIYTKSPTGDFPYGIIKQSHENKNVIVSPLYGVFKPKTKELGYILENYFESPVHCHNYLHSLVQIGAKHTMNITNKTFLSKELYIPVDHNEQKKIYNTLYSLNKKIELVKKEIELVNKYKRGLIQKMFI